MAEPRAEKRQLSAACEDPIVDELRIGRAARTLRHRLSLTQTDVGQRAGVSQGVVSLIETGRLRRVSHRSLRRVLGALDADLVHIVRWRGGELDSLLDERHAWLGGRVADLLAADGWTVVPEVTYSSYGERGSIDLVAWHQASRTLLVIELKSELTSAEETLRRHDTKVRLAATVVGKRFGWRPRTVARLLVLPDHSTARRRIERHRALFERAYPARNVAVRRFLRRPLLAESFSGLWFVPDTNGVRGSHRSSPQKRVRGPSREPGRA